MIHRNYVDILVCLYDYGYLSARDIADLLNIDHTNIYQYLDKLVEVGWINKDKGGFLNMNPVYQYYLTEEGRIFLKIYPYQKNTEYSG